jgi:hypothetical protein
MKTKDLLFWFWCISTDVPCSISDLVKEVGDGLEIVAIIHAELRKRRCELPDIIDDQ